MITRTQERLPGMPGQTSIERFAEDWVLQKDVVATDKEQLDGIAEKILEQLKDRGETVYILKNGNEMYKFEVRKSEVKLKVSKLEVKSG